VALEFCDFRRAFWQLGKDHREVLMLVGVSGLSYEEAAKVCNCAVGTIESRVSRARQELTTMLSEALKISRADSPVRRPVRWIGSLESSRPLLSRCRTR
jgi:RNA polymerase sigma-70 factor (ECF subfamily)